MAEEVGIDDVVRKGQLLDIYGPLLTERQRVCMHLYFDMNLSLREIADELDVSRQSVYDMLRRTSKALENYEDRLGILARNEAILQTLQETLDVLKAGKIDEAKANLSDLIQVVDE